MKQLPWRWPDKPTTSTPEHIASLNPAEWVSQCKYDGWRMPIYIDANGIPVFFTSKNKPFSTVKSVTLPRNATDAIRQLGLQPLSVLDCEFVGPRGHLQPRIYIFDCWAMNGEWLKSTPYSGRLSLCMGLVPNMDRDLVHLATTVDGKGEIVSTDGFKGIVDRARPHISLYNYLRQDWSVTGGLHLYEGVVIKRLTGTLALGGSDHVESKHMFKIKYRDIRERRY